MTFVSTCPGGASLYTGEPLNNTLNEQVPGSKRLSHLKLSEAESIHILREVDAEFERPVMLYSVGKDSSVMLRLAQNAFFPGPIPFPLLHVDTGYKFKEMIEFRDSMAKSIGAELLVWRNEYALAAAQTQLRWIPNDAAAF
jgi:sulfate adenylyltransferase subunit 2